MIIDLQDIRKSDTPLVGGKGANLGELLHISFPVPPGFVITTDVCRDFFAGLDLSQDINALTGVSTEKRRVLCGEIAEKIRNAPFPIRAEEKIMQAYGILESLCGAEPVCVVRSSATAEDSGGAAFAGQHHSYYYVTRQLLTTMVKNCWASLWTLEAVTYREARGFSHLSELMAVVVQQMIMADVSGVTFSVNPLKPAAEELVTESGWGLGAAVVDGRITPDYYRINRKDGRLLEKRIAEKRFMTPATPHLHGEARLKDVPPELRKKETLSTEQVNETAQWALKAEEHFDAPQDIEWVIADGRVYVVQTRPITTLETESDRFDGFKGKYVIFKPLLENFTEPMTPLSQDLLAQVAPPGMALIYGWVYLDLNYLRYFFPFKMSDEEMADWLYDIKAEPSELTISLKKLPLYCVIVFFFYLTSGMFLARTRGMPNGFMDGFRKLCRKVADDSGCGPARTISHLWTWTWRRFFDPICNMPIFINVGSIRYALGMALLSRLLKRWIPPGERELLLPNDAVMTLCTGGENILSAEMGRGIRDMAATVRHNRTVFQLFTQHKAGALLTRLKEEPEAETFLEQLEHFFHINGHRAVKEIEIRSPRWEENPAQVLGMIKNYVSLDSQPVKGNKTPGENRETGRLKKRQQLEEGIHVSLLTLPLEKSLGIRRRLMTALIRYCRYFIKLRENSRFYHVMGLSTVRKKVLEQEKRLLAEGKLKCKDDIFFLYLEELAALESGDADWPVLEDRVRKRRLQQIRRSKTLPPKTVGIEITDAAQHSGEASPESGGEGEILLKGQPASGGFYEGVARVILDISADMEIKPGEILVAPYTDPAWTPLFLTAGAAVVEVGSFLSHAGTVAREFGMPCVVDVPHCTSLIRTGMRIRVDGSAGTVHIIEEPKNDN
ncbi:MAG: hypothetical protein GY765_38855 [bacterium]|nr:hypothetical protein [bacterium]